MKFKDLEIGTWFAYLNLYYIKITATTARPLGRGIGQFFEPDTEITKI